MNKYGTLKQCPKCNCEQISTKYIRAEFFYMRLLAENYEPVGNNEYMERKCNYCGYTEKELPIDNKGESDE